MNCAPTERHVRFFVDLYKYEAPAELFAGSRDQVSELNIVNYGRNRKTI